MERQPKPLVRVTQIEAFRRWTEQSDYDNFEITEQSVIDGITGTFAGNDLTRIGTAFHSIVETGAPQCRHVGAGLRNNDPIDGDPERLKQVFCNVLDNAAKHGGAGKRIDASISREGEFEVVRVRDYGPGIPEAELPFIKQKFYKGSSKARGSGIGLAVCDEIVGLHNGIFTIGNAVGGGAEVTIRLPIKE